MRIWSLFNFLSGADDVNCEIACLLLVYSLGCGTIGSRSVMVCGLLDCIGSSDLE